ncbi:MAG: sugar phosphate isomerase/epimerase family protein [Christensenellales bacterium]|jgi:sugar phosphate isomerase/epimerase
MDIGISTASFFGRLNTEDALQEIGRLGVRTCEVFLGSHSEYTEDFAKLLADIAGKYGVRISSVHSLSTQFEPQLFSINDRQAADARVFLKRIFKAAEIMGAGMYVHHGPTMLKRVSKRPLDYKWLAKRASMLADMAADYGVKFTWENVQWCLYGFPGFARELNSCLSTKNLYYTLDLKQAARSGYNISEYVKDMGERMVNLHICDYVCGKEGADSKMPGEGQCDFNLLKRELDAVGYNGPAILEVYIQDYNDSSDLLYGVDFLNSVFNKD